jgi:hypothetical protein
MINALFFAAAMAAAPNAAPAQAAAAKPATPPAAPAAEASLLNMVPPFIGACMNPGPDPKKMREAIIKAGGQSAPEQAGKDSSDPSRLSGYRFQTPRPYSVIFNGTGTCAIVSREADVEKTKSDLAQFVAGSTAVFDINISKMPPAKPGETILSSFFLSSKKGGPGIWITLSSVTRDGETATFLSRHLVQASP